MLENLLPPPITDADPAAFTALRSGIPRAQRIRHFLALDLAEHVTQWLREHKKSRRWLAQRMEKTDSELSKWLSGSHNLTLESIAKLSDALGEDLLVSPRFPMGFFGDATAAVSSKPSITTTGFDWLGGSVGGLSERELQQLQTQLTQTEDMLLTKVGDYGYAMAA